MAKRKPIFTISVHARAEKKNGATVRSYYFDKKVISREKIKHCLENKCNAQKILKKKNKDFSMDIKYKKQPNYIILQDKVFDV